MAARRKKQGVTFEEVRELLLSFPGMEEGTSFGTPAFRVRKQFIARFHEDGQSLVLKVDPEAREVLTRAEPESCYITAHYEGHPTYMLVRVAKVPRELLEKLVEEAWRVSASKRQLAERERVGG